MDDGREDRSGGAGLGLPIARGIAPASGGELVAADPLVLDGASFVLTLPVCGAGSPVPDHGREARLAPVG